MSRIPILIFIAFMATSVVVRAQKTKDYRLLLNSGAIVPEKNISIPITEAFNRKSLLVKGKKITIIQFENIPTERERIQLLQYGIELLDYIPNNAYTACIKGNLNATVLKSLGARSVINLKPEQKMSPLLAQKQFPTWAIKVPNTIDIAISFPKSFSYQEVSDELKKMNFDIVSDVFKKFRIITVRVSQHRIAELAALPYIEYVQADRGEDLPINNKEVLNGRGNVLQSNIGRNLSGQGVAIGIGDDSELLNHIDFAKRVINHAPTVPNTHGTHVTGTAAGAGIVNEQLKGFAPKATIISQATAGILTNASAYVKDYGMVITNNSYGNSVTECATFGVYDIYSRILDLMADSLPTLQNVFAAGNSGLLTCSPYIPGFGNVLGGFQTAKNVVSIGNTDEVGVFAPGTSKGPVRDGRIKPEIAVQGRFVYSTVPTNGYGVSSGTSMAAPGASGGLALLYQRYRQLHAGSNPRNALMKALLCNGARDIGNDGPDFTYGFGWMNLLRSVKMLENNNYFNSPVANGNTNTHTITVPSNTAQLKVMLYWSDPAAAALATQALVNDLDLEVDDPSSLTTLPRMLNTNPSSVNAVATTGKDHINNIEQVVINNPASGSYTLRVIGNAVVQNPQQEYFLVYDTIPVSTTITYPIGEEHFSQGDSHYISWDSYGDPANPFTIEFSTDNGNTWSVINSNVAATSRQLLWTVPNVSTHEARIKITKNGTGQISTSEKFSIVGIPVVTTATEQCEGYFAISWTAIPEATGYEVMILNGVEMQSVAILPNTQTSYTFSGLSKDSIYWVTVRSLLNGAVGRRAIAISRQPNSGTCAGSISNNDLKVDAVLAPAASGRELTSTALSASTVISVLVKNLDDAVINNFNIKYSVNGAPFISESNIVAVNAGATYTHHFIPSPYNFSGIGQYQLRIVVENTSAVDPVSKNDTLTIVVKHLANLPLVIPPGLGFMDDIEAADSAAYYREQIGLQGLDRYDFVSTSNLGRLRTFVSTGIAYSGNKALTLDIDRYNLFGVPDSLKGTFNLANFNINTDDIRFDFLYKQHGQFPDATNKVWIRGSDQNAWIEIYDLYANQVETGLFKKSSSLKLSNLLAANSQTFSSSFQIKWGQWGNIITADNDGAAGYTFDNIHLYKVIDDIEMIRIDTPTIVNCGLGASVSVRATVHNNTTTAINNIPIKLRVDGGAITTETISTIAVNATIQHTFGTTINLSAIGRHTIEVWVDYTTDSFRDNDTVIINLYNSPIITAFPYLENFEVSNDFWFTGGEKISWEYGTPVSQKINGAASGSKAWKTSLTGHYNDVEQSYLYSPCFNIAAMTNPTISFNIALDLEDCGSQLCDALYMEYSADGATWTRLGSYGSGTNWYNKNGTSNNINVWSVENYTGWHVATSSLPIGYSKLRVRFVLSSDQYANREGVAIDDVHVYDNIYGIYDNGTMGSPVSQVISGGTSWVDFVSGGKLIASIQPNNENMGNTDVQAYINTGSVRNDQRQYYHNRNITIKPTNTNLTDSAIIRFYFLDKETDTLIKATGCGICTKPATVRELGVSKYDNSNDNLENGTILDNSLGSWSFIAPSATVKVPFDKGYYAEFKVKNFSEFWLNNGGFNSLTPLPLKIEKFTAIKKDMNDDVWLEWRVSSEQNVIRYEIEVAKNNDQYQRNNFVKVGQVIARNAIGLQQYNYQDVDKDKTGVRYYRIKIIDNDGHYSYSDVRSIVFSGDVKWQAYPNPSVDYFNIVFQLNEGEKLTLQLYDLNRKLIKKTTATGTGFIQKIHIDMQSSSFVSGLYFVEMTARERKERIKIIKL